MSKLHGGMGSLKISMLLILPCKGGSCWASAFLEVIGHNRTYDLVTISHFGTKFGC